MENSEIKRAEILFIFSQDAKPKAVVKKKYADGSRLDAEGIQSFEKALILLNKFLKDYNVPSIGETDTISNEQIESLFDE